MSLRAVYAERIEFGLEEAYLFSQLTDLLKGSVDPFLQSEPMFNEARLCFQILLLGNGFFIIIIIFFSLPQGCVLGKAQANTDALCDEEDE